MRVRSEFVPGVGLFVGVDPRAEYFAPRELYGVDLVLVLLCWQVTLEFRWKEPRKA